MNQQMSGGSGTRKGAGGKPTSSPLSGIGQQRRSNSATWGDADPKTLINVLESATEMGALVSFSKTSDGGAMRLYIKMDRDTANFYGSSSDEIDAILSDLEQRFRE